MTKLWVLAVFTGQIGSLLTPDIGTDFREWKHCTKTKNFFKTEGKALMPNASMYSRIDNLHDSSVPVWVCFGQPSHYQNSYSKKNANTGNKFNQIIKINAKNKSNIHEKNWLHWLCPNHNPIGAIDGISIGGDFPLLEL